MNRNTKLPEEAGGGASDMAAWAADYERTVLPGLIAARRQARQKFAVLLTLVAAAFLVGGWVVHGDRSGWWLAVPVVAVLVAGALFVESFRSFESRFRQDLVGRALRLRWPQASHDPAGRLASGRLKRAGLFRLTHRHEMNDLLRLEWNGLPVALCSALIYRRVSNEANKIHDQLIFAGTVFEVGCQLPLTEPVVVAPASLEEHPWPPGALIAEVDLGLPDGDPPLRVWAQSEAAARAALSGDVLSRLAALVRGQPRNWQLVFDAEGIVGAIQASPATFTVGLFKQLPTAQEALGEIDRVQAALDLVGVLTAGRAFRPRPLTEFEGTHEVLAATEGANVGSAAAARAAALTAAREAGLEIDDWGDRLEVRYRWPAVVVFNAAAVVVWLWVAAEIAGLAGHFPGQGHGLNAVAGWVARFVPAAAALPAWLAGWHPWSTLIIASTCLPPWWRVLVVHIRRAEVSRREATVVCGLLGLQRRWELAADGEVRVENGAVQVAWATVSPRLSTRAAAGLARLLALDAGRRLTLPPSGR